MATKVLIGIVFCLMVTSVRAGDQVRRFFVFGDSFVDTGNTQNPNLPYYSLRYPYGETFPGFPTGRWSNGKVMADFVADYLGFLSPVPYTQRLLRPLLQRYGMNFARGGTGVFDTLTGLPTLSQQIDEFQGLVQSGLYPADNLNASIALVSYAGNDYRVYFEQGGSIEGLAAFRQRVIDQLASDLQRLQQLGLKKLIVTNLQAIGCSPTSTYAVSYAQCVDATNYLCIFHNQQLQTAVANISSPIVVLDNYNAFLTVLQQNDFGNRLKGCCLGTDISIWCGTVANGTQQYTLCRDPAHTFWWDNNHPTHAAWRKVVDYHNPSLAQFRI